MSKSQKNKDKKKRSGIGKFGDNFNFFNSMWLILIIIFGLNLLIPAVTNMQVKEVPYSTFVSQVDAGSVTNVDINTYDVTWTTEEDGKTQAYTAGKVDDPQLVERLEENNVTYSTEIYRPTSPIVSFLLSFILPFAIIYWLMGKLMRRLTGGNDGKIDLSGGGGFGGMNFGKSDAKIYVKSDNSRTFTDVAGQDEAKESLEEVVDYLKNPKKYKAIGAQAPRGVLLVGPPGTGKTLMAQAVAGEANVPFFSIAGSEFVEMFVGRGAAKVRDLFKQANEKAPCIVFIDEIDTIGKSRENNMSTNDEREQTLNQLLTEMDGFEGDKGVIILAATNRPESLDKALLRPGRFDRQISMELPDLKGREEILRVHAKDYKMGANIDYRYIARATAGASGADLANIINEAGLRAVRNNHTEISQIDLDESVDVVLAGQIKKNDILSAEERRIVSYHEIGHALVAAKQSGSAPVEKITIIPRTSGALGYTMQVESGEKSLYTKQELYNQLMTLAGGRAAEEVVFGQITTGASNDIQKMTKIARAMVTQYGMSDTFGMMQLETQTNRYLSDNTQLQISGGTAEKADQEVISLIKRAHQEAGEILMNSREKLDELAEYLIQEETITGEQFMKILNK
ncbi:ATP-dependent metallopeptidase FtsH/Yme1/Tma family protein [Aerococcus agrisoli]|uniref:ATP-dependent zinc metalloprotease FtsH n=1 Tax=Aerococcus agrisoli TaxID=2487350 RepID=A0A3N4GJV3_9LACT|nr:ATP-dependent zinc metalloprotease FtsH [Aerococcus agrisoli]RPA62455.1 ATP-dependent metallopeptidase FtsH/Yme1/Tma family protein [Aerococcus agrisoli]